jgi:hypothetical protein
VLNKHRNYFASIHRIAFGVGDGAVRIWNLSKSTSLEITSLQQQKKAKVMAVSIFYICQFMHVYHMGRMTDCRLCAAADCCHLAAVAFPTFYKTWLFIGVLTRVHH